MLKPFNNTKLFINLVSEQVLSVYGKIPDMLRQSVDKQCFVDLVNYSIKAKEMEYCAIGTIYNQLGLIKVPTHPLLKIFTSWFVTESTPDKDRKFYDLTNNVTEKTEPHMICPDCGMRIRLKRLIIHLNDTHRHIFPVIADKLEIAKPYDKSLPLYRKIIDSFFTEHQRSFIPNYSK